MTDEAAQPLASEAELWAKISEQDDLIRILQDGRRLDEQRHGHDDLFLRAERLLREGAEHDRDTLIGKLQDFGRRIDELQESCDRLSGETGFVRTQWGFFLAEVLGMFRVKDRIRAAVYGCFPEFDVGPEAGARSWPAAMQNDIRGMSERMTKFVAFVHATLSLMEKRRGTVVLLAPDGFAGPRFLSHTVVANREASGTEMQIPIPLYHPMKPGGWVVSHGCTLSDVFVGNTSQARGPESNYCMISDEVPIGQVLQVRVRFD